MTLPQIMRLNRRPITAVAVLLSLYCGLSGCDAAAPASQLPITHLKLGNLPFTLEIANNDATREFGLMKRDAMPADHGMIFVFEDEKPRAFWMKNTRIPLDIAFLDSTGKVVSIRQMKAYDLTPIPSDAPARYAIELNLNAAAAAGLKTGDLIEIPPEARPGAK